MDAGMDDAEMDVDEANLPPADECQRRSEQFASITNTDTAMAMMFLQDTEWDLERALNAFFRELCDGPGAQAAVAPRGDGAALGLSPGAPRRVRCLSWNLDGLDERGLKARTEFAARTVLQAAAHVVLLQEVVAESEAVLRAALGAEFHFVVDAGRSDYFCAALVRREGCSVRGHETAPFPGSVMGRGVTAVRAEVQGAPCLLMTAHLESTRDHAQSRKEQLRLCWQRMLSAADHNVLFAGDLNLRDHEVAQLGGVPAGIEDMWESCGSRPEARFSWDPKRNTNAGAKTGGPGMRFDRMYLRRRAGAQALKPVYFELSGIEKLPHTSTRFASDHWAILGHFDIV